MTDIAKEQRRSANSKSLWWLCAGLLLALLSFAVILGDRRESTHPELNLVDATSKGWIGAPQREEADTMDAPGTVNLRYYDIKGRPEIELAKAGGQWFYTHNTYQEPDGSDYSRVAGVRHYWRPPGLEAEDVSPYNWQDYGWSYTYDGTGALSKSYVTALTDTSNRVWWDQPVYDHLDRVTSVRKGSGHVTTRTYRPLDGVLTNINTGSGAIQNLTFNYDGLGNLRERTGSGGTEAFGYDNLNRLTTRGGTTIASYDAGGNITAKATVTAALGGSYGYAPVLTGDVESKPHAVRSAWGYSMKYDANGNLIERTGNGESWSLNWTGFDKPRWMAKTTGSTTVGSEFHYNANRSRVMQLEFDAMSGGAPSNHVRKRLYGVGPTLEANYNNTASSGTPDWQLDTVRVYVSAPDGTVGTREFKPNAAGGDTEKLYVYHHDHLGSIESITPFESTSTTFAADPGGKPGRFSEDAWGQRRDPSDWLGVPVTTDDGGPDSLTPRGFTGHEMLDDLGLVHMNGRIYDPLLGRMLSADIVVQAPGSLQSYNRYSYVMNNPLTLVDPSGFTGLAAFPGYTVTGELLSESGHGSSAAALNGLVEHLAESYNSGKTHIESAANEFANASSSTTPGLDRTIGVLNGIAAVGDATGIVAGVLPGGKQVTATAGALAKSADEIAEGASKLTKMLASKTDDAAGGAAKAGRKVDNAAVDAKRVEVDPQTPAVTDGDAPQVRRTIPNDKLKYKPSKPGNAPIGQDGKPVELHHTDQKLGDASPRDELTRTDHRGKGNFKKNHDNTGQEPSKVDRDVAKKQHQSIWRRWWNSGRFNDLPEQPKK